jgi:hypothetical protein
LSALQAHARPDAQSARVRPHNPHTIVNISKLAVIVSQILKLFLQFASFALPQGLLLLKVKVCLHNTILETFYYIGCL